MVYILITSLIWAFSFPLIKAHLSQFDSTVIAFCRMAISFLVFLPFMELRWNHRAMRQFVIGALQFGLMYVLYIRSFRYLQGHQVALLTITTPVFVVLFAGLFQRTWKPSHWWASLLVILGSGLLVPWSLESTLQVQGILLLQAANACFACGQILQKRWESKKLHRTFGWSYLGGLLVPFFFLVVESGFNPQTWSSFAQLDLKAWTVLVYLGIIASGLGFYLWNRGVCQINSGLVSIANNLKIPLSVMVAYLLFREEVDWIRLGLSSLAFLGAFLMVKRPPKP